MHLTKSLFIDFCDYPKLAWWKLNNTAIYKKIRKIETEEQEDHIMQIGQAVEDAVMQLLEMQYDVSVLDLMPRFHKLKNEEGDEDDDILHKAELDLPKALADTLQAIRDHVPVLYQPTFKFNDCLVRADFMVWNGSWYDLYEVKAKSWIRKDITDNGEKKPIGEIERKFINDVSFQVYVINNVLKQEGLGQLSNVIFCYLNKEYIKQWQVDIEQLIIKDLAGQSREIEVTQRNKLTTLVLSDALLGSEEIEAKLDEMRAYLVLWETEANVLVPRKGSRYLEYFWEDKVFGTIMGAGIQGNAPHILQLHAQNRILLSELTQHEIDGFNTAAQEFITKYLQVKKDGMPIIDRQKIAEVFGGFSFPICFYDYETISAPVPLLDTTRPYMQTIVQYSLHKYYADGTIKHYGGIFAGEWDFSCTEIKIDKNPNTVDEEYERVITWSYKHLLQQMIADIWDDLETSTFIVRHEGFENSRNKEVAKLFPDLTDAFLRINQNTYDLKRIVSDWYYFDLGCKGSASIKKVLPVIVPEMTYDGMEIGRWDLAMRALYGLITHTIPVDQRQQTIISLLKYCWQDTLAMVRMYECL